MKNAANCASTCELQDTWTSTFRTHIAVLGYYSWTTPDWGSCKQPDCLCFVTLPYITCGCVVTDVDGPYMPCGLTSILVNGRATKPFLLKLHTQRLLLKDYCTYTGWTSDVSSYSVVHVRHKRCWDFGLYWKISYSLQTQTVSLNGYRCKCYPWCRLTLGVKILGYADIHPWAKRVHETNYLSLYRYYIV